MTERSTRRDWLQRTIAVSVTASAAASGARLQAQPTRNTNRVLGANDAVQLAVIGVRGKGNQHINEFRAIPGVRIAGVCDVDETILQQQVKRLEAAGEKTVPYIDIRKLLESKEIDAVVIATPNHWHSLMAIWSLQAGKDVYVEKPISHNVWEGRKVVEAARKYKKIVQPGTQSRSDTALKAAFAYLQEGNLGKILLGRGFCYKPRTSIGHVSGPQPIPSSVHYDLWTGPAPLLPLTRKELHYDWHWVWPTGNGDIGNQGVHEMDMCRWAVGAKGLPSRVMSIGGRFGYEDDATTPNTQIAVYDYSPAPIIFEVRGLPQRKGVNSMDQYRGVRIGVVIQCERGYFAGGAGGGWAYDNDGKRIQQFSGDGGGDHTANFIRAVRSRRESDLNGNIEEAHYSSALCHLANISYRLGQRTAPGAIRDAVASSADVKETLQRFEDHLSMNWVDVNAAQPVLGPSLEIDTLKERFVQKGEYDISRFANELLKDTYREPFVVPETV